MYSGLTISRYSGRMIGAHQQIDRVARRHLQELLPSKAFFPSVRPILNFEGKNGPDGVKRKSPGQNEPWHYFDPLAGSDPAFSKLLAIHYEGLVKQLKGHNKERAAFEAAWLAHTIVDGLTPAHHYPFEQMISELRSGKDNSSRQSYRDKIIFKGDTRSKTFSNMFKAWGPKGIFTAHFMFELGFGFIIKPLRFPDARPTKSDIRLIQSTGYHEYYMQIAKEIAELNMYERYIKKGWTNKLNLDIREKLAPLIIKAVTLMWYQAAVEAEIV